VDIVLGGSKPELKDYRKETPTKTASKSSHKELPKGVQLPPSVNQDNYKINDYAKALEKWQKAHDEVVSLGGLHILGSERHESRRIDNQLRGRAGRQGDPGSSQFFISLEDEIMRLFGGAQISKLMDFLKIEEDQPIEHGMIGNAIQSAQVKVEGFFFDQRKRLVEFDDVMNKQREVIYKRRRRILEQAAILAKESEKEKGKSHTLKNEIVDHIENEVTNLVMVRAPQNFTADEYDAIVKEFTKIIPFDDKSQIELRKTISSLTSPEEITSRLMDIVHNTYKTREEVIGEAAMRDIERFVMLQTIDEKWMEHLDEMDNLRDGIWMRGDKNTVLSEYKREGFNMFDALVQSIESNIAQRIFRVHIQDQPQIAIDPSQLIEQKQEVFGDLTKEVKDEEAQPKRKEPTLRQGSTADLAAAFGQARATKKASPGVAQAKIGRNDPCPCGAINPTTGKVYKYKQCGLVNAPWHGK
jgi:preprotein translocase subunit SecA